MSKRRVPRRPSVPRPAAYDPEPEAIAQRVHQIAATAGVLAEVAFRLDDHGEPLSHALYLIEETLLEVERRIDRLRPLPR